MKNLWISLTALGLAVGPTLAQRDKPATKPLTPPPGKRPQDRPLPTGLPPGEITVAPLLEKPPTPEELAEGKKRLDGMIAAHGGDAFLKMNALTFSGKGFASLPGAGDIDFDAVKLTYAAPDKARLDVTSIFGEISQVVPGGAKKSFMVMAGQIQDPPFDLRIPDPTSILREAVRRNLAVRAIADTFESEKSILRGVALPEETGKPSTRLYYDAETKLVRRIVLKNKQGELTVNLSGYKTTEGIAVPGTLAIFQGKEPLLTLNFTGAKVNPSLANGFFDPPTAKTGGR